MWAGRCWFLVTVIKSHLGCGMEKESEEARVVASQGEGCSGVIVERWNTFVLMKHSELLSLYKQ